MKSKKGADQAIWIIIGLVIALLALFLFIFFLGDKVGTAKETIDECESYNGQCRLQCSDYEMQNLLVSCETGYICCVKTE